MGLCLAGCLLILLHFSSAGARNFDFLRLPSEADSGIGDGGDDFVGTRWAVLIAGSSGYMNYRHQADVCHAYQVMKKGGLKDENIIVFMYDDIAYNMENPRPGVIINHPNGVDVYAGVPKDYVGENVNVGNFFAVLLGNKSALTGGSGKVVDSGPNDHIFVFYSDHGGPGVLGMPTLPYLYANDLIDVLKKKHASGTFKSMVFYLEACESGSIFEGLLPEDLNIYATTAANAEESSWGTYCPGESPSPPLEYSTCLGDLYSVAWMEDSDVHNLRVETLEQQYNLVKARTSDYNTYLYGSHVMRYGDKKLNEDNLFLYIGSNPANDNFSYIEANSLLLSSMAVNQRDADLVYYWNKFQRAPEGSSKKLDAQKELFDAISLRFHIDNSVELIGKLLFGSHRSSEVLRSVRPKGQPLVDDWRCLKAMVRSFEMHCGSISQYGMKYMRSFANICNAGIKEASMAKVSAQACVKARTSDHSTYQYDSHVMRHGDKQHNGDNLSLYIASNPADGSASSLPLSSDVLSQRDSVLLYYFYKLLKAPEGSLKKVHAQKELLNEISLRWHIDNRVDLIGKLLFGSQKSSEVLNAVQPTGQPLVDDWGCLKAMVMSFEKYCGPLSSYVLKHMHSFASFCNAGVKEETMADVSALACFRIPSNSYSQSSS